MSDHWTNARSFSRLRNSSPTPMGSVLASSGACSSVSAGAGGGTVSPSFEIAYTCWGCLTFFSRNNPMGTAVRVGWFLISSYTFPEITTPPGGDMPSRRAATFTLSP